MASNPKMIVTGGMIYTGLLVFFSSDYYAQIVQWISDKTRGPVIPNAAVIQGEDAVKQALTQGQPAPNTPDTIIKPLVPITMPKPQNSAP